MTSWHKLLHLVSQILNTCAGHDVDETLSARAHRQGWANKIDRIPFFGPGHCKRVWEQANERAERRSN